MDVTRIFKKIRCCEKEFRLCGVTWKIKEVVSELLSQRRVRFQRQLIAGEMVRPEGERQGQGLLPQAECLARNAVDQIEADVVESGRDGVLDRGPCLPVIVTAAQKAEQPVVKGLNADVDAVDPGKAERFEISGFGIPRIHLDGDFRFRQNRIIPADGCQDVCDALNGQDGRRSAADVYGVKAFEFIGIKR